MSVAYRENNSFKTGNSDKKRKMDFIQNRGKNCISRTHKKYHTD